MMSDNERLAKKLRLTELLEAQLWIKNHTKIDQYYPEDGPLSRHAYKKHMEYFEAGADYRERAVLAGNRIGKTEMALYELVLHLTGRYPDWWQGRRFEKPIRGWISGTTGQTTRDILQYKLFGPVDDLGSGLIPYFCIKKTTRKAGSVPDTIEGAVIQHFYHQQLPDESWRWVKNGWSRLVFKSHEQGRKSFEGDAQHVIVLDEECKPDIYTECLTRTMTTGGMISLMFTPLEGLSETVLQFMPGGMVPTKEEMGGKFVMQATWEDAPHLDEKAKADILKSYPEHEKLARSKGIPQLGSGKIFPYNEEEILIEDFDIPEHWPIAYALDVGWNCTAAAWGAWDLESDTMYIWSVYKRGVSEPVVHAEAIKSRGAICGVADPASLGRGQKDGTRLMDEYRDLGLDLEKSKNAVEAGIFALQKRMSSGTLKVFKSCQSWVEEFRIYRRDEKGRPVKQNDHLMDCTRYLELSGKDVAKQLEKSGKKRRVSVSDIMERFKTVAQWG
jgi:phage terminase large subunit-like protein